MAHYVGIGYIGLLCNLAYTGMRAQNSKNNNMRALAFVGGFPTTLVTYLCVEEGSERAYGVELPKKISTVAGTG